jgi:3-oxoacyl-[acyl-carrier protein] reductase
MPGTAGEEPNNDPGARGRPRPGHDTSRSAPGPGNTYFPGGIWAGIEAGNPELYADSLALNPTGRMAKPAEIAYAVTMLASPRASFITGTNVVVDGALTRGVQF